MSSAPVLFLFLPLKHQYVVLIPLTWPQAQVIFQSPDNVAELVSSWCLQPRKKEKKKPAAGENVCSKARKQSFCHI